MSSGWRIVVPILLAQVAAAQLSAPQAAPPRAADAVIRVSVNLVEVDAMVTDSKGNHVSDLRPEDFTILEDGKPQTITQFAYVNPGVAEPSQIAVQSAGSKVTTFAPAGVPRMEDVHRTIVLMVDNLHMHPDSIGALEPVLKKFLEEHVSAGDLVSVMATKSGMGLYESFTSDKRQLQTAVDRVLRVAGDPRPQESDDPNATPGTDPVSKPPEDSLFYDNLYQEMSMNALGRAIEGMREIPGRKAVVFFSDGIMLPNPVTMEAQEVAYAMSDRAKEVAELANRYGVILDTFDPAGLQTPMSLSRPMGGMPSAGQMGLHVGSQMGGLPKQAPMGQRADAMALMEVPAFLARETGGVAIHNINDISSALGKAMQDMTGYYLMAYQPQRDSGKAADTDKEHRIQVKVRRSGLTVRSRKGYTSAGDEVTDAAPTTREEQLGRALFSPFNAGGIGLHLTPLYSASAPDAATNRRSPLLRVALAVDGRDLLFRNAADGKKEAVVDLVVGAYDAEDRKITSQDKRYTVSATPAQAVAFRTGTVDYEVDVPIVSAGAYQVRAAVRDDASGKLGSAYTFLMIPDFNKPQLSLSSLVLGDPKGGEGAVAARQFMTGGQVSYGCEVFGSGPAVEVEFRLFRGGTQVYASKAMPLMAPASLKAIPVAGKFNLTSMFAPGDYAMEFIARDLQAPGAKAVTQWSDFSITAAPR